MTSGNKSKDVDSEPISTINTVKEINELGNEIDLFIKQHEQWKKQIMTAKELPIEVHEPAIVQSDNFNRGQKVKEELIEMSEKCGDRIREFNKARKELEKLQEQKVDMDRQLELYKQKVETKKVTKEIISPLNDLQTKFKTEAYELSKLLKGNENSTEATTTAGDKRVAKLLLDIDKDMQELDLLLA
eukprot:TRINITY_DN15444_c0_g1_i1.p1 TRINITY_DN15444_c0_g1~~TRINITY_DN15444_c0_g1_i1.p1  ORF type:complete len:187 (+),score=37.82 TRINITY_DN15444_c0_g1_i1:94-654(+)